MATIHQCDRCGKYQAGELQSVDLEKNGEFPHNWGLCPECIKDLRKFMQDKKGK